MPGLTFEFLKLNIEHVATTEIAPSQLDRSTISEEYFEWRKEGKCTKRYEGTKVTCVERVVPAHMHACIHDTDLQDFGGKYHKCLMKMICKIFLLGHRTA